jgi:predicted phage tail protein
MILVSKMLQAPQRRGVIGLASDAITQAADLIQTEFKLARAEFREKLVAVRSGFSLMIVGAVFLVAALFLILQAAVAVLVAAGMEPPWAVLIVAGASALVGGILVQSARQKLAHVDVTPNATLNSLRRDGEMAKEKLS